jgi:hypothetical protein
MGPAIIAMVQSFFLWRYLPDAITEMVAKKREERAKEGLLKLYSPQNTELRYKQIKREIANTISRSQFLVNIKMVNDKNLSSLHLALLRQFCGETYIVIYARQIMTNLEPMYADVTPVIVNGIQMVASLLGIVCVQRVDRFTLILSSSCLLAVLSALIGVTDYLGLPILCIVTMAAFMMPSGAGLSSVAWSYPSELAQPSQGKYASLVNWTAATIVSMVPPFITRTIQDNNAYPIFFFFSLYLLISVGLTIRYLPKV